MTGWKGESWLVCIETAGAGIERAVVHDGACVQWLGITTG